MIKIGVLGITGVLLAVLLKGNQDLDFLFLSVWPSAF